MTSPNGDDFSKIHNVNVEIIKGGDANQVLTRAKLNAGNPEADLIFGIDNIAYRGIDDYAKLLMPYKARNRKNIPSEILNEFNDSSFLYDL